MSPNGAATRKMFPLETSPRNGLSQPFDIQYATQAVNDLKLLRTYDQRKILSEIESHLRHQPRAESQSRIKAMVRPFWSHFRQRVDDFRVLFYDVTDKSPVVGVLCIVEKRDWRYAEGTIMTTLNCTDQTSCDEMVRNAAGEDLVLMRNGRAVALAIPFDDDDLQWYARERDPAFLASVAGSPASS